VVVVVAGSISSTNKPRLHPEPIFHTQKLTNANVEQYIEIHQRSLLSCVVSFAYGDTAVEIQSFLKLGQINL
jgi:hypothetical protein